MFPWQVLECSFCKHMKSKITILVQITFTFRFMYLGVKQEKYWKITKKSSVTMTDNVYLFVPNLIGKTDNIPEATFRV